ncbi:multicopper oxidase family protein [Haematospirillum sp. 15-248]|uniref:multicopper oxidase family protein n=1 Tax=Haematospirillum sp. 15-248 TaxID=2723107 RepID=UPI00143B7792|nr:multicopper oxidase family protein [Haematospirillum sp. 15-248]NKD87521.1 multicopper oxidase family protein [Haematospirillum sp. 15-248]
MSESKEKAGLSRRSFLGAGAVGAGLVGAGLLYRAIPASGDEVLYAIEAPGTPGGGEPVPVLSYARTPAAPAALPPVLDVRQGDTLSVHFHNAMARSTTVHWHGIRLPIAMDGVPFLTQNPVARGEAFHYRFAPPDAGTYWYHPHYASLDQIGAGLAGILVVREADDPGYDADIPLLIRDWRRDEKGAWLPVSDPEAAGRAGTFGGWHTVNWEREPHYQVPSGSLVRLRLCNADLTRVFKVVGKGAPAILVAVDGHPLVAPEPLQRELLGPGMRMDVVVRMPDNPGEVFELHNVSSSTPWVMMRLVSQGMSRRRALSGIVPLPPNPVSMPSVDRAEVIRMDFNAGLGEGGAEDALWSINKRAWVERYPEERDGMVLPVLPGQSFPEVRAAVCGGGTPLAVLKQGRSYILELNNFTPHLHPIHIHGLAFSLLSSSRRSIRTGHFTDTALLLPKERMRVALVADNPGDWMVHCHIIEHQAFGMMGTIRVDA